MTASAQPYGVDLRNTLMPAAPIDVDIGLPQTVGLGISNESLMDGRLLLAADALFLDWSSAALFQSK